MEEEKEKKLFHRCDGEGSQGDERSGEELSLFQLLSSLISLSTSFAGRVEEQKEAGRRPPPKMKICHIAREKTLHGFRAATSPKKPLKSSKLLFRTRDVGLSPEPVFRAHRRYQEHSISLRALPTVCNSPTTTWCSHRPKNFWIFWEVSPLLQKTLLRQNAQICLHFDLWFLAQGESACSSNCSVLAQKVQFCQTFTTLGLILCLVVCTFSKRTSIYL